MEYHVHPFIPILITVSFLIGAIGNVAALWILYKSSKKRNKKHVFMSRCLACNDLVAQVGMLIVINLRRYNVIPYYWSCVGFVVLRGFGLASGCVAFVMALERWLALTKPFLYHQVVTYPALKRFMFGLWITAISISYLPLFGFGLYYDNEKAECIRFRYATSLNDKIYAYMFCVVGSLLCLAIVLCNVSVVCELSKIKSSGKFLIRRISKAIIVNKRIGAPRYQTPEEVAFSKLMAYICIIFIVCWTPQAISVPLAQFIPDSFGSKVFMKIADILLCTYFTLDPFIYVLQRYIEKGRLVCFFRQASNSSIRTTTTVVGRSNSALINIPQVTQPTVKVIADTPLIEQSVDIEKD